jgi:hypothetical protein
VRWLRLIFSFLVVSDALFGTRISFRSRRTEIVKVKVETKARDSCNLKYDNEKWGDKQVVKLFLLWHVKLHCIALVHCPCKSIIIIID